jgi:shikimate kinase
MCSENIVLIGFMGSGKSSVGRLLSQKSGRYFLDADALIESAQGKEISSIFEKYGEEYFRELEKESARWMAECVKGSIISTGGGMPLVVEKLHDIGKVVYLKLPFEKILDRISPEERAKRPLFQDIESAKNLFNLREKIYKEQAEITLNADRPIEEIVDEILFRCK